MINLKDELTSEIQPVNPPLTPTSEVTSMRALSTPPTYRGVLRFKPRV